MILTFLKVRKAQVVIDGWKNVSVYIQRLVLSAQFLKSEEAGLGYLHPLLPDACQSRENNTGEISCISSSSSNEFLILGFLLAENCES